MDSGTHTKASEHTFYVPEAIVPLKAGDHASGSTRLEQSLPGNRSLVVVIPSVSPNGKTAAQENAVVGEELAGQFDVIIGVDTGGDSLTGGVELKEAKELHKGVVDRTTGRDVQVLNILKNLTIETHHVVFAPGCDGESTVDELKTALFKASSTAKLSCSGSFSLEPMISTLKATCANLDETRTPRIILSAFASSQNEIEIPVRRGRKPLCPVVPREWLTRAFDFVVPNERSRL